MCVEAVYRHIVNHNNKSLNNVTRYEILIAIREIKGFCWDANEALQLAIKLPTSRSLSPILLPFQRPFPRLVPCLLLSFQHHFLL